MRNEQDEYQAVVDPHALEASRRTNKQGTDEATWASSPKAKNVLASWNGKSSHFLLFLWDQILFTKSL